MVLLYPNAMDSGQLVVNAPELLQKQTFFRAIGMERAGLIGLQIP